MRTLCYSVRLESLVRISDKCFKAVGFDGSEALIPAQFICGPDYSVYKSDAYWIAGWILERKSLTYSRKKSAWFDEHGNMLPETSTTDYVPDKKSPVENNIINQLKKH